jgi:hypothetical protein
VAWTTAAATLVAMVAWAPQPFIVPYQPVVNPLATTPAADRLLGLANVTSPSASWPFRWAPGRWWCGSAAPAGSNASNCAGWPLPRPWWQREPWSSWCSWRPVSRPRSAGSTASAAHGLLTILLGLGYAAVVLGLGRLVGQDSSLVVAAATLAVAAVFQPARRNIQAAVDRRFNRRRHDAGQLFAAFSARLRDQVALDTLSSELLAVVDQTMQPTRSSLWLRPRELFTE